MTVVPVNATEIIKQWTNVLGLSASPSRQEIVDGHPRRVWENGSSEVVIEDYIIADMAHGTPIAIISGEERHGLAGPFLLDVGIASSYHIAKFWGLVERKREHVPTLEPQGNQEVALGREPSAGTWIQRLRAAVTRALQRIGVLK
jgi:poly(3-hydroxybutyrate) depolymerase